MKVYHSFSSAETKALGKKFAEKISNFSSPISKRRRAVVVALTGGLGSGKTTFIQGFLGGLGVRKRSTSPTFIIFRRFALSNLPFASAYHVDAYRIKKLRELLGLGFGDILADKRNIVMIEWADKVAGILPRGTLRLRFLHGAEEHERTVKFGNRPNVLL